MIKTLRRPSLYSALCLSLVLSTGLMGQAPANRPFDLPALTGPYHVGRVSYHWTDSARPEVLSKDQGRRRELMVHLWYPTDSDTGYERAAYFLYWPKVKEAMGVAPLRCGFGPSYTAIDSGQLRSHAVETAPISKSKPRYPILIFSHGLAAPTFTYTVQFEGLASHGYVVAAIDHTYDSQIVVFPDGRSVPIAREWEETMVAGDAERMKAFEMGRNAVGAADIRFVVDQLAKISNSTESASSFSGKFDLDRIGAFGHSLGSLSVSLACQEDARIRACFNQDGLFEVPFFNMPDGKTMDQPYLLMLHREAPSDAQLTERKVTRPEFERRYADSMKKIDAALAT